MIAAILWLIFGFVVVIGGADRLVKGASSLAVLMKVPEIVIGLTVVAFGTSAPELVVNIISVVKGHSDIALGNVIGSNLFNLMLILGIVAVIYPIQIKRGTLRREIPFSLGVTLLLLVMGNDVFFGMGISNSMGILDGMILVLLFGGFLSYTHRLSKTYKPTGQEVHRFSMPVSILWVIAGLAGLVWGGKLVVENAVILATMLGVAQKVIGVTIVAMGTSLPELATCAVAAYHKRSDLVIGNVIGSNIFNILLILGASALIRPLNYNTAFNHDLLILSGATLLLVVMVYLPNRKQIDRWNGLVLLLGYVAYMMWLLKG